MINGDTLRLKRKVLGLLIRNARTQAGLQIKETATLLGISAETVRDYEYGDQEPSLPELEAMARIFDVPVSYFWSDAPFPNPDTTYMAQSTIAVRRKQIGALLRQAREKGGRSEQDLANFLKCSTDRVAGYEFGRFDIPFNELIALASYLNVSLAHFLPEEIKTPNGNKTTSKAAIASLPTELDELQHLNDEVLEFLMDPANVLYLRLSMRLQNLSAENLRALAEGILDITY
jgi:transcriptional regulator with XRE-family HTH domain